MKINKYSINCPLCGKPLFRSSFSVVEVEIECPKCHTPLLIRVEDHRVVVENEDIESAALPQR